jgi:hypothetical protein
VHKLFLPPFIAGRAGPHYVHGRMSRLLSTLLLAFALLLSPLAMIGGAHAAMPHTTSSALHCADEGEAPQQGQDAPEMNVGCAMSCAAIPAAEPAASAEAHPEPAQLGAIPDQLLSGVHPEGETPPPRIAPEI